MWKMYRKLSQQWASTRHMLRRLRGKPMAKKNLALELGTRYVAEFYNGALFVHEGKLCRIINVGDGGVHVEFVTLENPTDLEGVFLPVDVLANFTTFQWPTLGYRQIQTKRYGTCVMHISANRSAHRG